MRIPTTIWTDLLDFLFPQYCAACSSRLVEGEEQLCLHCMSRLPYTAHSGRNDNAVMRLFADLGCPIQAAASMLNYSAEKNVQRLIFSLKYYGNRKLAFTMGRLMAIRSRTECSEADFLLPVPLHRRRERRRGYNQAEWLCRGMSSVWGTPVATHALRRRIATGSQAHKSHAERRAIMQNNVFVTNRIDNLAGKKLLLVDDVITTGSTLTACAMPLLNIPEVRLCVLTLAAAAV